MLKSVSSLEIGVTHLHMQKFDSMSTEEIMEYISSFRADGIFAVTELIRRGVDIQTIYEKTWITHLFLESLDKTGDAGFRTILEQTHKKYFDRLQQAEAGDVNGVQLSFITDAAEVKTNET